MTPDEEAGGAPPPPPFVPMAFCDCVCWSVGDGEADRRSELETLWRWAEDELLLLLLVLFEEEEVSRAVWRRAPLELELVEEEEEEEAARFERLRERAPDMRWWEVEGDVDRATRSGAADDLELREGCLPCQIKFNQSAFVALGQRLSMTTSGHFFPPPYRVSGTRSREGRQTEPLSFKLMGAVMAKDQFVALAIPSFRCATDSIVSAKDRCCQVGLLTPSVIRYLGETYVLRTSLRLVVQLLYDMPAKRSCDIFGVSVYCNVLVGFSLTMGVTVLPRCLYSGNCVAGWISETKAVIKGHMEVVLTDIAAETKPLEVHLMGGGLVHSFCNSRWIVLVHLEGISLWGVSTPRRRTNLHFEHGPLALHLGVGNALTVCLQPRRAYFEVLTIDLERSYNDNTTFISARVQFNGPSGIGCLHDFFYSYSSHSYLFAMTCIPDGNTVAIVNESTYFEIPMTWRDSLKCVDSSHIGLLSIDTHALRIYNISGTSPQSVLPMPVPLPQDNLPGTVFSDDKMYHGLFIHVLTSKSSLVLLDVFTSADLLSIRFDSIPLQCNLRISNVFTLSP
ncbi:hypothetical protein Pelo_4815 [Pelomyxa schiedti]|nr:hypothetical protein Pelo_4815 [Pelomyxa schiedti]